MTSSNIILSLENRPLKRPRLGPPDLYPQDPKQREDELTAINVKQGFVFLPTLVDEFGSAKNSNINAAKLGAHMNGALSKKIEANTFPDTGKRRLQVNTKDHFWHVTHTPRHKQQLESWMKDLAGNHKPLSAIAKKVPIFNKREEIFLTLAEYKVPLVRAGWFLKMTASYNSAISEAKTKKRQMPDPSQEWTISLARCCKEVLVRLAEWYNSDEYDDWTTSPFLDDLSSDCSSKPSEQEPPNNPPTNSEGSTTTPNQNSTSVNGPASVSGSGTNSAVSGNISVAPESLDDPPQYGVFKYGPPPSPGPDPVYHLTYQQWLYCMDLAKYLYEDGLLDRHEWLIWVIDMVDKISSLDDVVWHALLPIMLSYLPDIAQSELLARRLATIAARKLSTIFPDPEFTSYLSTNGSPVDPPSEVIEALDCFLNEPAILGLASAIQVVLVECPSAMVYNGHPKAPQTEGGRNSIPAGSPLDILPMPPSVFPMPERANNHLIRAQLREAENQVVARSRAVEANWSCDEWQRCSAGSILEKVLSALDCLDHHSFDRIESSNSLESLYSKIFTSPTTITDNPVEADAPIVLLLCQWAVGVQRTGEYRALAVARLLEQRQSHVMNSATNNVNDGESQQNGVQNSENGNGSRGESSGGEDVPMIDSEGGRSSRSEVNGLSNGGSSSNGNEIEEPDFPSGIPVYHNLLFRFLDTDAPTLDDSSPQSKVSFSALVNLFSALIRHDVFSHDSYLCTLVARGDLSSAPQPTSSNMPPASVQPIPSVATPGPASQAGPTTPASVQSLTPSTTPRHDVPDDRGSLFPPLPRMPEVPRPNDFDDDPDIDDDLDRILQHITQEQQNNIDQVDSPRDGTGTSGSGGFGSITPNPHQQAPLSNSTNTSDPNSNMGGKGASGANGSNSEISKQSRHRQYVTHFQLPQDENYQHEASQRHILLYGVGRTRDEARHVVKKVSKELGKLFSKKFCHDIADSSKIKRSSKTEINFDTLTSRYASLTYYDQHAITSVVGQTAVEMLSSFAANRGNYLPTVEHVSYLIDLMELGLNINGLLETCVALLRDLADVDVALGQRGSSMAGSYSSKLQLQLVAVLRRYHCCLLLDTELTMIAWESLIRLTRRISTIYTSSSSSNNFAYDCTSAERCTLAYVIELHNCCAFLKSKNLGEYFSSAAVKLTAALTTNVLPSESLFVWQKLFMAQYLEQPKKVDSGTIRQLAENPTYRFSFVCNAILKICNEGNSERVNDLACLCADVTAACPSLASEWLGVLKTLSGNSGHGNAYREILREVDVKQLSTHSSLASLTALLVARQCFSLQDFVMEAVPSILNAWNEGRGPSDADCEAGARLTGHLLLGLFKTPEGSNMTSAPNVLKQSCDRRLLFASHSSLTLGAVLAVQKAMLLLADLVIPGDRRKDQRERPGGELSISHILGTTDAPGPAADTAAEAIRVEPRSLSSFAYNSLQQLCSQHWIRLRCLQSPVNLVSQDLLLDPILSAKQAQRLLHLICYPSLPLPDEGLDPRNNIPRLMEGLNQWNLGEVRIALQLQDKQLSGNSVEYGNWLDIVARSALEVFHLGAEDGQDYILTNSAAPSPAPGKSPRSGKKTQQQQQSQDIIAKTPPSSLGSSFSGSSGSSSGFGGSMNGPYSGLGNEANRNVLECGEGTNSTANHGDPNLYGWTASAAWLLAPLVAELSPAVQGRVLRHAGNVLESKHHFKKKSSSSAADSKGKSNSSGSLQALLPFLALILTCLRGQDEQREGLLASLLNQFTQILALAKYPDVDLKSESLRDVIRLRLSLVGGMFDSIQRSSTATAEWAVVLTQLVTNGIIDLNTNSDIFPTIIDMVTALVHSTQIADTGDRIEEMKRQNMNLIKKLKKEVADRDSDSIKPLRQLLPFSKVQAEIIVTQATSIIVDSKGNRVQSFEFVDKKPGLQVWEKQKVSPWEIIEGQKNPAQLSWGWFGAVKMERKPLRYQDGHRLLKFHTHTQVKPTSHFVEPVPLPPEDMDVKPEIVIKEEIIIKPDTPSSDQSPRGPVSVPGRKPKAPRKRRQTKAQQQAAAQAVQVQVQQPPQINSPSQPPPQLPPPPTAAAQGSPFGAPGVQNPLPPVPNPPPPSYPPGGNPQQWFNGNPQQQQSQQQTFYPQGPGPGMVPGRPAIPQTKQALHNMLRQRHQLPPTPNNQFQQFQPGPPAGPPGPRHQNILRQQLRGQTPMANQNFQGQPGMQPNQGMIYQQQPMQTQQGMNQNYAYNQPGMNTQGPPVSGGPTGANMMNPQQQPQMNPMMAQRLPVSNQDMTGFMQGGPQGPGQVRPQMGQRPPGFMQGNPQQGNPGMNPMQTGYARPQMSQMGQPGQMVQQGPTPGQMGMSNPGQMSQMGQPGMQSSGQMSQGMGIQNQGMVQSGQIGNPGQGMQGQLGQPVHYVQFHPLFLRVVHFTGKIEHSAVMQNPGQMGQPGMQNPNMGPGAQRMRQFAAMQHQQQQQGMGMGPGSRMQYQNQPGGY